MPSNQSNYGLAVSSVRAALDNFMESYKIVDSFLQRARDLAPTPRIKEAIDVEYVRPGNGKSEARVIVDLAIAPEGRAYEYGSGIHSRRGSREKYPIIGNPYLTFNWEAKGRVVRTHQVMHPGVAAKPSPDRGYMATALQETKKDMQGRMQAEFGNQVSKAIRVAFKGS